MLLWVNRQVKYFFEEIQYDDHLLECFNIFSMKKRYFYTTAQKKEYIVFRVHNICMFVSFFIPP